MAIFDIGDKIQRWKYIVKFMKVTFPNNETINIPIERVRELNIEENYEEYYFPLVKIKLVLDSYTYYSILKNKNDCKINLRVDRFYFIDEEVQDRSITRKFINDEFELIMDESTDDMTNSLKEDENKSDYTSRVADTSTDLMEATEELSFYLFKTTITETKKNVNKIFSNCNVSDAIVYLATVAKINNILMAQPDNTNRYGEFFLPPLSILRAFEFIDLYYGIYKQGTMIYFGLNYTYIIPYSGKCTAYHIGEKTVTNIIIPKSTNLTHKNILGTLNKKNDKKKNYIVADYSTLNIQNQSISNNYLNANDIQIVDSYDNKTTKKTSDALAKKEGFMKITENRTMNNFYASMYTAQTKGKSIVVSLRLQDFDISSISPNKEFNLIFEDPNYTKKYNGKYLIAGVTHNILSEGEYMGVSSIIVLRKME